MVQLVQEIAGSQVQELCSRIESAVSKFSLSLGRNRFARVGISIGTATFNTDGETLDQLIAAADGEMYRVKSLHKVAQTGPSEVQPGTELRVNRMTATG